MMIMFRGPELLCEYTNSILGLQRHTQTLIDYIELSGLVNKYNDHDFSLPYCTVRYMYMYRHMCDGIHEARYYRTHSHPNAHHMMHRSMLRLMLEYIATRCCRLLNAACIIVPLQGLPCYIPTRFHKATGPRIPNHVLYGPRGHAGY